MEAQVRLSKSRYTAGLQCLKRAYLATHNPELADPLDDATRALFSSGTEVGVLARRRFSGGRLVEEPYDKHAEAEESTQAALKDMSVRALYEAAFTFKGIRVRVDILARVGEEQFDLVEVKSSTGLKAEHIPDLAIQLHVLRSLGISVRRAMLMHVNNQYVYAGGEYDLEGLFSLADATAEVEAHLRDELPGHLMDIGNALRQPQPPNISIGPHCSSPNTCFFYNYCRTGLPEFHVESLPRANWQFLNTLLADGLEDIRSIPSTYPKLSALQRRVRDVVVSGKPYVGSGLGTALDRISAPTSFLDFETYSPALPLFPGTRPYQPMPFQWSLQIRSEKGNLKEASFLHGQRSDPRAGFLSSLLEAAQGEGSIVMYSPYERTTLNALGQQLPEHSEKITGLIARMVDLLALVQEHYYHPEFMGSFSIKSVLPALVPDLSYSDLKIQDGQSAGYAFARMVSTDTPAAEQDEIKNALLAYCGRDTLAMVRILDVLTRAAGRSSV